MASTQRNNIVTLPAAMPTASAESAKIQTRGLAANVKANTKEVYPYVGDKARLDRYASNSLLFDGEHFDAFKIKVDNELYNKNYSRLRYIVNNFPGLISKICADMMFGEPPRITLPEGENHDNNSDWLESWIHDVDFFTTMYEASMTASYKGDAVFKLRVGELHDPNNMSIIVEQVQPDYYFPKIDPMNVNGDPKEIEISFIINIGEDEYLRKEIHTAGKIRNELWKMDGTEIEKKVSLSLLNDPGLKDEQDTGIDRILIVHNPNWKDGRSHYGKDDYYDLITLFYAINNRLTKIDNILDKHSDPILAIPDGVLDEEGHVKKEHLGMFEKGEDGQVPEYVVWNASLEAAFTEIDHLLESLYLFSEISPDAMGRFKDATAESGRALKYRMMRTVAKVRRKQLYFDHTVKEIIYLAQLLAAKHKIKAMDKVYTGDAEVPSVEWKHPIPQDSYEQAQEEELRLASGNQTLKASIMNIDDLTEEQAEEKVEEIYAEKAKYAPKITVPVSGNGNGPEPAEPDSAVPGKSPKTTPSGASKPQPQTDPYGKDIKTPTTPKPANAS